MLGSLLLGLGVPVLAQESAPPAAEAADEAQAGTEEGLAEAAAAEEYLKFISSLDWKTEGAGEVGKLATVEVPAGYRFTGPEGTIKLMEKFGNLTNGQELGFISPDDMSWFAVFEFDEIGYVKDDEKDSLDAAEILKQLKEGQQEANKELARRGMSTLEVVGWKTEPFYNPTTKNLEWALRLRSSDGGEALNYRTKLLGRRGVMDVVVVCDESQLDAVIAEYQKLLTGFSFNKEESYASFTKGDKIAEYGLTGLILGGGLLVAAKSGLLNKLVGPIIGGLAFIGVFLKRLFGGKSKDAV
jgi:uncharacterized membrane-anchored protein